MKAIVEAIIIAALIVCVTTCTVMREHEDAQIEIAKVKCK